MWFSSWAPGWFWIIPLLMLGLCLVCMLLMFFGRFARGCGCGCCGRSRPDASQRGS